MLNKEENEQRKKEKDNLLSGAYILSIIS